GGTFLPVAADGGFTFPNEIDSGGAYGVGISQLPAAPAQRCEITNGQGSVGDADVADIAITCATRHARFALVANHDANTLTTYAIDGTTGRMSLRDYAVTERDPVGVVVDASGRFVYVAA